MEMMTITTMETMMMMKFSPDSSSSEFPMASLTLFFLNFMSNLRFGARAQMGRK